MNNTGTKKVSITK